MKNKTSISVFLKDSSIDNDFERSAICSIYDLKENLIAFDTLINAPEYEPTDEPISIFRNMGESKEEEVEEEKTTQQFKDTLRTVMHKFMGSEVNGGNQQQIVVESEGNKMNKIPDIGKTLNFRILQGVVSNDQIRIHQLVQFGIFQENSRENFSGNVECINHILK